MAGGVGTGTGAPVDLSSRTAAGDRPDQYLAGCRPSTGNRYVVASVGIQVRDGTGTGTGTIRRGQPVTDLVQQTSTRYPVPRRK